MVRPRDFVRFNESLIVPVNPRDLYKCLEQIIFGFEDSEMKDGRLTVVSFVVF